MKRVVLLLIVMATALWSIELRSCVATTVSPKSTIFSCVHGEYYVEYSSSSKREVNNLRVLYTAEEKYRYLNRKLDDEDKNN